MRDLRTLSPNMKVFIKSFPSQLRGICGRRGEKTVRVKGMGDSKETLTSRHTRVYTQTNSARVAVYTEHAQI